MVCVLFEKFIPRSDIDSPTLARSQQFRVRSAWLIYRLTATLVRAEFVWMRMKASEMLIR